MRSVVFRLAIALIWLVVMVVCIVEKNMSFVPICGFTFVCFALSGVKLLKNK